MGVEYYFYAPVPNMIFDVGKLSNFERFKPFLTGAHRKWVLIHEDNYQWYPMFGDEFPKEQRYTHKVIDGFCEYEIEFIIPKDVQKIDCFGEEFQKVFKDWEKRKREYDDFLSNPIEIPDEEWKMLTEGAE